MKKLILLLLTASCLLAQNINVQKNGSNALTGSFVVPSGVSVTATGTGQIIATNIPASPVGNSILAGNGSGGFQNVTIGSGLSFTGNTLSSTSGGTVTSFSVTTNNGVVASVINSTTTPVLNISLGAITPTTVNGNTISTGTGTLNLGSYTITLAQSGTLGSAAYTATTAYDPAGAAAAVSANSLQKANNLSDLASTSTARTNLGVTATGQDTTYAYRANNLSDLASASTARTNLGLGTVATQTAPSGTSSQLLANNGTGGFSNVTVGSGLSLSGGTLTSTASGGTVTSVSTNNQSGIITSVSNATTTPNISISLGNITPLSDTSVFNGSIGQTTPNAGAFNSLKTTTLTGYLYGNSTSNVTASTTIPTTALSGTVTNAQLANNSITIAGTATSLGGSITQDQITGLSSTGIVKRTAANTLATAVSGTDYAPATSGSSILYGNGSGGFSNVTVGSGLTFSGGTLTSTGSGGTVTSVSGTGSVNGITLTGTVTSSGSLTLGGTLSNVNLTSQVTGTLPVANGGTGVTASTGTGSTVLSASPTFTGTLTAANLTATGTTTLATSLSGYLSASSGVVSASSTIPTTALSGTITNAQLANSSITIAGTSTALGGSISQDTITGLSTTGLVKRTAANTLAIATSGTDYAPATSGTSLLYGNGSGGFSNATVGSSLTFSSGALNTVQGITTTSNPQFGSLGIGAAASGTSGDLFVNSTLAVGASTVAGAGVNLSPSVTASGGNVKSIRVGPTMTAAVNGDNLYDIITGGTIVGASYTGLSWIGVGIGAPSISTGSLTNAYGMYIYSGPTATNSWGLYQAGTTAKNHFDGAIDVASTNVAKTNQNLTPATSTISASAIDWSVSNSFYKTLSANTTFTFSNAVDGQVITICLLNTTSNYTVTWPTIKWAGGTAPIMTTGAHYDVYTIYYNATVGAYFGSYVQNF